MKTLKLVTSAAIASATLFAFAPEAAASIKNPNDHPAYRAELEPHINSIFWRYDYSRPVGRRGGRFKNFGDPEFGAGFRATIELADPAFIPKLNNTVGISFGVDVTNCQYCRRDLWVWVPVTLQWNFFFNEHWSAFGDIGGVLRGDGFFTDVYADPAFMLGGRYHFNDNVALTLRLGIPFMTFGVSFFVGS